MEPGGDSDGRSGEGLRRWRVSLLLDHLLRHEQENEKERWARAPAGTFGQIYTPENLAKSLRERGWCRLWVVPLDGKIVAHASLYDLGEPDGVVFGHVGIEHPYRKLRLAEELQALRLSFCDEHGLTLCGAVALGNDVSFHGSRRWGYEFLRFDPETSETWLFRSPRQSY